MRSTTEKTPIPQEGPRDRTETSISAAVGPNQQVHPFGTYLLAGTLDVEQFGACVEGVKLRLE